MNYNELLGHIIQAAPELENKVTVDRVQYKRSQRHACFYLLADIVVGDRMYTAIRMSLQKLFPGMKLSLRVASPSLKDDFLRDPNKYAHVINSILLRTHPALSAWEFDMRYLSEDGRVVLELPDAFAMQYLRTQGLNDAINRAIFDIFFLKTEVLCRVAGLREETIARMEAERQAEQALQRERQRIALLQQETLKRRREANEQKRRKTIYGRAISRQPVPICDLTNDSGDIVLAGKRLDFEEKVISDGDAKIITFNVTDYTGTIKCKLFMYYRPRRRKQGEEEEPITEEQRVMVDDAIKRLLSSDGVLVKGNCYYDTFDHECTVKVNAIMHYDMPKREDTAAQKRVELHMHTQMSTMDAVASATDLINRAAQWGHPAVAITDHGVVQAFPEAFFAAKQAGIKLLPGVEGYLADNDSIVSRPDDRPLDTPVVVLDFETTGLDTRRDRIIEIGAVKLAGGHVVESLSQLVYPGALLKPKIAQLTGITDQMLVGQPPIADVMGQLLGFIGDCPVAAHNASFDLSVLASECERMGISREFTVIDTLSMARKLYPEMKSHKLASVCRRLGVSLKDAHRAVHDAQATALCLQIMAEEIKRLGAKTLGDIDRVTQGYALGSSYHIVLLAASQTGLQNINRLISEGHLKYFRRRPHMPRESIQKYREGVLVGSACESGELFSAVLAGEDEGTLSRIARFYDYLEIQPVDNNAFLIREGRAKDRDELREYNRTIVHLGEKLGIPVVATGDVHFLDPQDSVYRAILQSAQGYDDCDDQPPLYLKTTDEMLEEFAYLGADKAREVVLDNPRKIMDKVGDIALFPKHPQGKKTFAPMWDSSPDAIRNLAEATTRAVYGDAPPDIVRQRLDKELQAIIGYGYATLYDIACKLVRKSTADGYLVGSRGSVGSSLVATMCGITEVNPLPAHYRCERCHKGFFDVPAGYSCGIDLPDRDCPDCGAPLVKDGYDIPFEVFLGFKGDKVPDIDLNFSGEYRARAHAYIEELFGEGLVYRAGTIGTLAEKTAYAYVMKYLEQREIKATEAEINRLVNGCIGVKRTTGQHPGGMVVLPEGRDINEFTAVQHPADKASSGVVTTHYDFDSMHDILVKLDVLGHDDPTMMHMLAHITGVDYRSIPLNDKKVMSLFLSPDALGVAKEDTHRALGTLGIPEFGTEFTQSITEETKPVTMEELIRISGLSHGKDVWVGNTRDLILDGTATLRQCICTRDDIMSYFIAQGLESKMSFDIMESVRKGKGLTEAMEKAILANNVPRWVIESCKKIRYMFPRGHAVAYVIMALRVGWYKIYRPLAYYAAYFTIRATGFDAAEMILPLELIQEKLAALRHADHRLSEKEKEERTALEMVLEMTLRGFRFLPVDLYKSDVRDFLMEGEDALRAPFSAIGGAGEAAAQGIVAARETPFLSVEDLKARAHISSAVIDLLRAHGTLDGLRDTNQVTLGELFDGE